MSSKTVSRLAHLQEIAWFEGDFFFFFTLNLSSGDPYLRSAGFLLYAQIVKDFPFIIQKPSL